MKYDKVDAQVMPARHTVGLNAADMEKAAIMYVKHTWAQGEEGLMACPTDSAVLSRGTVETEQDYKLVWHTKG